MLYFEVITGSISGSVVTNFSFINPVQYSTVLQFHILSTRGQKTVLTQFSLFLSNSEVFSVIFWQLIKNCRMIRIVFNFSDIFSSLAPKMPSPPRLRPS